MIIEYLLVSYSNDHYTTSIPKGSSYAHKSYGRIQQYHCFRYGMGCSAILMSRDRKILFRGINLPQAQVHFSTVTLRSK